jgi:hypothetical protein
MHRLWDEAKSTGSFEDFLSSARLRFQANARIFLQFTALRQIYRLLSLQETNIKAEICLRKQIYDANTRVFALSQPQPSPWDPSIEVEGIPGDPKFERLELKLDEVQAEMGGVTMEITGLQNEWLVYQ